MPAGFAPIAIGLTLTLIHLISIPVTNTSVNPARSTGQALFVGPTAYFQLSPSSRLTAAWSVQAWGRPAGSIAALDLVNFERHHARLVFGVNF